MNQNDSKRYPKLAKKISVNGTTKLLELAKEINAEKIIYLSTSQVYGKNLNGIVSEKTKTIPINTYSIIHRQVEEICSRNSQYFKNGIFVLRLSNIMGSPQRKNKKFWKLVCNDLCLQAVKNKEIILNSDGKQYRDFLSIYNLIEVIEKIIETKKFKNKTHFFNIGSGKSITIMELAKIIKKRCKSLFSLETKIIKNNKSREIFIKYLYVIKKLKKSKISFSSNYFLKSIDETLKYCYNFKN